MKKKEKGSSAVCVRTVHMSVRLQPDRTTAGGNRGFGGCPDGNSGKSGILA